MRASLPTCLMALAACGGNYPGTHGHKNLDILEGQPLQTALDIFAIPDTEVVKHKSGAMFYQWRAEKDDAGSGHPFVCFLRAVIDKNGVITTVRLKGDEPACRILQAKLDASDLQPSEKPAP